MSLALVSGRLPPTWRAASQPCRRASTSALAVAAADLRPAILRAACGSSAGSTYTSPAQASPSREQRPGDWAAVRGQAATVAAWPSHPLGPMEKLGLADALIERAVSLRLAEYTDSGILICDAYRHLMHNDHALFGVRAEGTSHCSVVNVSGESDVRAATGEAAALLLGGHAVSLAAPAGPALDAIEALAADFPPALLQAVESAPMIALPASVRALRTLGSTSRELWSEQVPPKDFGGFDANGLAHGMSTAALALGLARTHMGTLTNLPRSRYEMNDETNDLASLLSTTEYAESPLLPGLPPPRWSLSAYDRGAEEVHDLLDLLWAFREPLAAEGEGKSGLRSGMAPMDKHFILTGGTDVPEDVVKTAMISALSPFYEPVTLHAIGLGARGLSRDPLRGFCRLVQSGRSGLQWTILEHDSYASFLEWLCDPSASEESTGPPVLFSAVRGSEPELRRSCAVAGGVAWDSLFVPDPLEQLRRWTCAVTETSEPGAGRKLPALRTEPAVEVVAPLIPEEDNTSFSTS